MNFYLDFEATRFSNRIISIGCVADNGAQFETLVKPVNKAKVDKFITELTGITNEMLATAPSADEAFNQLFDFIELNSDGHQPMYYCYGNTDVDFLQHTVKYMEDTRACICAQAIQGTMIDYAIAVKKFFVVKHDIALRKVYMLITSKTELVQSHDALEDALMLKTVVNSLYNTCKPEDKDTILAIPSQRKYPADKKAPAIFQAWSAQAKWEADTLADETNWVFKCTDQHSGNVKYFNSSNTAALWAIKYMARNVSPKKTDAVQKIESAIIAAHQSGKCRYNCYWEYNPEGAIVAAVKEEN
jgi:DNA polymerase III epsilon subunit-like protein